jgi:hypothetical protein
MGGVVLAMLNEHITLRPADARKARRTVRTRLLDAGLDDDHAAAIETIVGELLGAAIEAGLRGQVHLIVERFPLLTSVRLRCPQDVELMRDERFGMRDRVLERLTLAAGKRHNADGTTDLWAEVPRSDVGALR